ncbi:MAG: hypothetical protein QOG76_3608, partial [Pseudonocardiales bacterium]|nr:hypothetical protein [Pseudonocardiales bacterium]
MTTTDPTVTEQSQLTERQRSTP